MHTKLGASIHPLALLPDTISRVWVLACKISHNKQTKGSYVISVELAVIVEWLARSDHLFSLSRGCHRALMVGQPGKSTPGLP